MGESCTEASPGYGSMRCEALAARQSTVTLVDVVRTGYRHYLTC